MIKAIIFDMDGLMIDSEPFHFQAFNTVLHALGSHLSKKKNLKYIGLSDSDAIRDMIKKFDLSIMVKDFINQKNSAYQHILRKKVKIKTGLSSLLKKLKKDDYKLAIASSSHQVEIETVLKKFCIRNYFETYISSDQLRRGKPYPDIYLRVAKALRVKPNECLVLEDALNGVKAAKAAGMRCYAIPGRETKGQDFLLADKRLRSLGEVYQYIEKEK